MTPTNRELLVDLPTFDIAVETIVGLLEEGRTERDPELPTSER